MIGLISAADSSELRARLGLDVPMGWTMMTMRLSTAGEQPGALDDDESTQ